MLVRALVVAAVLTATAYGADFDRRLGVSGPADLYVSTNSGHIHVTPGGDGEIHVRAHVYSEHGGDNVEQRIRQIAANPPIAQSGSSVHVGEVPAGERPLYNDITIDYEIQAPRSAALNLRSGSGDLEVDNLGRFLKAETGSGSVRAHGVMGAADLHTGSGDIQMEQQMNGQTSEVRATTGSGSVRLNGVNGAVTARSGSGDIEVNGRILGATKLRSGSGSIRVHAGHDARLTVDASTGSGSIRVAGAGETDGHHLHTTMNGGGAQVEVETGSGDVEVN